MIKKMAATVIPASRPSDVEDVREGLADTARGTGAGRLEQESAALLLEGSRLQKAAAVRRQALASGRPASLKADLVLKCR
ncbi:hypothetical protein [Spirillospora sp. CA-128828]|uniref:hypothetical protein n=1 Tax=Spirillospora sp. CA-128828 TaxID=3240033 RepID=UPI003D92F4ED